MLEEYRRHLGRWRQIVSWYLDNIVLYKRQVGIDLDLSSASKPKMKTLLDEFVVRLEEYLAVLAKAQKRQIQLEQGLAQKSEEDTRQETELREEFGRLVKQFEKLAVTTPSLLEIKRRIDEKIRFYDHLSSDKQTTHALTASPSPSPSTLPLHATAIATATAPRHELASGGHEEAATTSGPRAGAKAKLRGPAEEPLKRASGDKNPERSFTRPASKGPDINDRWIDSLIAEVSQKNEKLRQFEDFKETKAARGSSLRSDVKSRSQQNQARGSGEVSLKSKRLLQPEDMTKYLAAFKTIQDEFGALKATIHKVREEQKTHRHPETENQIERVYAQTTKIEADNQLIQREHAELLHTLHILSTHS